MTRRCAARAASEEGTTLVEFSIVLPLVFMLLFGIMSFARALYTYHFVSSAAREGTRYASVRGSACTSWTSACPATATDVQNYLRNTPTGIDPTNFTVITTWPADNPGCPAGQGNPSNMPSNSPGCAVHVEVQYNFQFNLPFMPSSSVNMSSSSQLVISQ